MQRHWRHVRCTSAVSVSVSVSGLPFVSYNPELELLSTSIGAELAGLYARVALLCAGLLPTKVDKDFSLIYGDVSPEFAQALVDKLMS